VDLLRDVKRRGMRAPVLAFYDFPAEHPIHLHNTNLKPSPENSRQ
jgi:hypothetical protein